MIPLSKNIFGQSLTICELVYCIVLCNAYIFQNGFRNRTNKTTFWIYSIRNMLFIIPKPFNHNAGNPAFTDSLVSLIDKMVNYTKAYWD